MPLSLKRFYGLIFLFIPTLSSLALAEDLSNDQTYIVDIRCEGIGEASCDDLIKRLDLKRNHIYSAEDFDSIQLKIQALDAYASARLRLLLAAGVRRADLEISLVEKSSVRQSFSVAAASVRNESGVSAPFGPEVSNRNKELYAGYAVSDHNFLGKGIFYQISLNLSDQDMQDRTFGPTDDSDLSFVQVGNYNAELAQNISGPWFWTARAVGLRIKWRRDDFGLLGGGYQLSPRSSVTMYGGAKRRVGSSGYEKIWGLNYNYSSQDHGLIPTQGYLLSLSSFAGAGTDASDLRGFDLRGHWSLGHFFDRQGVLSLSLQGNSPLNPAVRNNSEPVSTAAYPESSLTYSLVKGAEGKERSAFSLGASHVADRERKSLNFAYKKATSNFDVSLGFMLVHEKGVRREILDEVLGDEWKDLYGEVRR